MGEENGQTVGADRREQKAPRRLMEVDKENGWFGTVFGITLGLLALWALSA